MTDKLCAAPWVHLHVNPNGKVMPCCVWDYKEFHSSDYGNFNNYDNAGDALNHPNFKKLRLAMLNGEHVAGCQRCYTSEEISEDSSSMRHWFNTEFDSARTKTAIDSTTDDGTVTPEIQYIDIRFSNLCNLKCRMCGVSLSSSWYDEHVKLSGTTDATKFISIDAYDKVEPLLEHVTEIYFAGGEPLLYQEHLQMILKLIEIGKTDVHLKYNTNMTTLKYKKHSFVELWKHFPRVSIGASIDGIGDVIEYIRTGSSWNTIKHNFNNIKENAPHINIYPSPTISLLNLEPFFEFHRYCIENGWYNDGMLVPNFVSSPDWYNMQILPDWYKQEISELIESHIDWLKTTSHSHHISGIAQIQSYMQYSNTFSYSEQQSLLTQLRSILDTHDISANLNWKQSLPHLDRMFTIHDQHTHS